MHETARSLKYTRGYVHTWEAFPSFKGQLAKGGTASIVPVLGQIDVVYFIASWCVPCQEVVSHLKKIEGDFLRKEVRFSYVFSHDVRKDVLGFLSAFSLQNGIISNHEILKTFHNPPLPAVYIGDRRGWLVSRFHKLNLKSVPKFRSLLKKLTAL